MSDFDKKVKRNIADVKRGIKNLRMPDKYRYKKIEVSPEKKIKCRGRNGCFVLNSVDIAQWRFTGDMHIGFNSKRHGKRSPVILHGNRFDLIEIFTEILSELTK